MPDTKENLKSSALKLFLKKGYTKTTIGEIESAAGLAPRAGSFYRHFRGKQELLIEIAKTHITEQPSEFDFTQINSLGNTRAELILIAQIYENASYRQKNYLPLIEEIRRTKVGRKFEQNANQEMLHALIAWISTKPAAKSLNDKQLAALAMSVFGGWLFYLTKLQQGVTLDEVERDSMLNGWVDIWSHFLDSG